MSGAPSIPPLGATSSLVNACSSSVRITRRDGVTNAAAVAPQGRAHAAIASHGGQKWFEL
jgi:hypothetical protein